jgi:L-threonylcarbamoyladenylate synthase
VTAAEVAAFERAIAAGGVGLFPADTVYGLGADPESRAAVERLYELKGRPPVKAAAVMFFDLEHALAAVPELGPRTSRALGRLLPGGVTVVLPDPAARFPLAGGSDPQSLGLRVPRLTHALSPLAALRQPVLQSSANRTGGPDPRRLEDVPLQIRRDADLVLDGGELPGAPSTVVDLRRYERASEWSVLREGAVALDVIASALEGG